VIKSFKCADTQTLFTTGKTRKWSAIQRVAERKLAQLDAATTIEFLRSPPGNHLEKLSGDREGQHSIRINDQWRICFVWQDDGAYEVEIVDYH
jgi:proteic killer suppression protein